MKIWSQCGAVCIAPEDDEERQACEIARSTPCSDGRRNTTRKRNSNEKNSDADIAINTLNKLIAQEIRGGPSSGNVLWQSIS